MAKLHKPNPEGKNKRSNSRRFSRSFKRALAEQRNQDPVQVFIKTPDGHTKTLNITPEMTISALKKALGYENADVYLTYGGKPLKEELTIADYNINALSTLEVQARLRGGNLQKRKDRLDPRYVEMEVDAQGNPVYIFTEAYEEYLKKMQREIPPNSGIVLKDIELFSEFAVANDSVVMLRNVNPRAGELLQRSDVIGKPMTMKGKSSNGGKGNTTFDPTAGFIPRNQNFSKIDSANTAKIRKFQDLVDTAIEEVKVSSKQLTTVDGRGNTRFWYSVDNGNGTYDFVFKKSDRANDQQYFALNKETMKEEEARTQERRYDPIGKNPLPLEVMADPKTGKLYTADYDTLVFAINVDGRGGVSFETLANDHYRKLDADKTLRIAQEALLKKIIDLNDRQLNELQESLIHAHDLQKLLNETDNASASEDQTDDDGMRKEVVKSLTGALRKVYTGINEVLKRNIEESTEELLDELQTSIEDTDLETPGLLEVRSAITLEEEVAVAHLNKETDRAIWHAAETTNKGAFKEELYDDLKAGVTVFNPNGEILLMKNEHHPEVAERALVDLINQLRDAGYTIIPNPRWGWEMDNSGRLFVPDESDRIDFNAKHEEIQRIQGEKDRKDRRNIFDALLLLREYEYRQHPLLKAAESEESLTGIRERLNNLLPGFNSSLLADIREIKRHKQILLDLL